MAGECAKTIEELVATLKRRGVELYIDPRDILYVYRSDEGCIEAVATRWMRVVRRGMSSPRYVPEAWYEALAADLEHVYSS